MTSVAGLEADFCTSLFKLPNNKKRTHILKNSKSRIDLKFISKPNRVIDSDVQTSLHLYCHHQIVYAKLDLRVFYPAIYMRGNDVAFQAYEPDNIKKLINLFEL